MNDFKNMSDRYRQQMMDFYNRYPKNNVKSTTSSENASNQKISNSMQPIEKPIEKPVENPIETTTSQETNNFPIDEPTTITDEDNIPIEEKYPEPIIPPFIYQANHTDTANAPLEEPPETINSDQFGYLKVSVTSAEGTIPVNDVSVIVSKTVDDRSEMLFTLLTNASGETEIIQLPAPPKEFSQNPQNDNILNKPYAEYTISAYLQGYFQIINTKVPIFSGVTSVQNINLIPLPAYTDERKVISITIPESEPNL